MTDAAAYSDSRATLRWRRWLLLAGRVVLAGIFGYAAYAKLRQPWMLFAMSVDSYQILPLGASRLSRARCHGLSWCLLCFFFWVGSFVGRLAAVTALLAAFFGVLVHAYMKGLTIDCGCFGPGEKLGPLKLLEDGSLLAVSLAVTIGAFLSPRRAARRGGEIGPAAQGFSAVR